MLSENEMRIRPEETELRGKWLVENAVAKEDRTCRRIEWLITNWLEKLQADATGWSVLYRDPKDGRYWELTYPESEMHGGGPPALCHVSKETAESKYGKNFLT